MKSCASFVVVCLLLTSSLAAQDLSGTWYEQRYKVTLVINANGTYAFQGPTGKNAGQAGVQQSAQRQLLYLRDATGRTYWYRIQSLTANGLVLMDPNGAMMTYARQGLAASTVIAAKGGLQLTQREVDVQVRLIQFVIGQNLKASELQDLKQAAIQDFNQDPQKLVGEMKQLGQTVGLLEKTANPYDAANPLALTDRDVAAATNLIDFRMRLQARPALNALARQQAAKYLVDSFLSVPVQTRRSLCSSQVVWLYTSYARKRMNQQQRGQYGTAYGRQAQPAVAAAYTPRPQEMSQSTYDAVRNAMLEGHAGSMNALESISGALEYDYSVGDEDY